MKNILHIKSWDGQNITTYKTTTTPVPPKENAEQLLRFLHHRIDEETLDAFCSWFRDGISSKAIHGLVRDFDLVDKWEETHEVYQKAVQDLTKTYVDAGVLPTFTVTLEFLD
jgi:hypothetical protein